MAQGLDVEDVRYYPAETLRAQVAACFTAWGMPDDHAGTTSRVMVDANECGIDTHGIALLTSYDAAKRNGRVTMDPEIKTVRETPVAALIDAGGSLGYVPSVSATRLAISKAKEIGMAGVAVRNSGHFGAAGYYTRMMAAEGLLGFNTTSCSAPRSAPTYGREAKLGTNPLSFAAPTQRNQAFALDMATTTVASGHIRVRANERMALPIGWLNDDDGRPLTDAYGYWYGDGGGTLTPLGGTVEGASYKGYGLGALVEILSVGLSGASLVMSPGHGRTNGRPDIGHFFLAINPTAFRESGGLEATVDDLIDHLHATKPIDPNQPVMVAGEPEHLIRIARKETGIPIPPGLHQRLREIAGDAGAAFLLD